MKYWNPMLRAGFAFLAMLTLCSSAMAAEVGITSIQPVFEATTPHAGQFRVRVGLKNQADKTRRVNLTCLYLGLTHPGVYSSGEPQVQQQFQVVELKPRQQVEVTLKNRFAAWHPETLGELVVTLVGDNVVQSRPVATRFRPDSPD
ncbi:MAG: hypothetical protein VB032_04030 [Burkholderiaceae bacterium]|nr:hypothetical protein [Burkholderiaceae bacterium]